MSKYKAKKVIVTEDGTIFEVEQLEKYNITDITGIPFDSKAEGEYYLRLKSLPDVRDIEVQPKYILQDKPNKIVYKADFLVTWYTGKQEVIDVKGMQTTAFRIKLKLFKAKFPHLPITLVKKVGRTFVEVK